MFRERRHTFPQFLMLATLLTVLGIIISTAFLFNAEYRYRFVATDSLVTVKFGDEWYLLDSGASYSYALPGTQDKVCVDDRCVQPYAASKYIVSQLLIVQQDAPKDLQISGLVGQDLLRKFSQVSVDYDANEVIFRR